MDRRTFVARLPALTALSFPLQVNVDVSAATLKHQITDFLSLRLTTIVIDDYIFGPLWWAFDRLKPANRIASELYRAVQSSVTSYEQLWQRLDWFQTLTTPDLRASAAYDVAMVAGDVNDSLKRLRVAVDRLEIAKARIMNDDPTVTIHKYTEFPGTPTDIEKFLVLGTREEIARIVADTKSARAAVLEAHRCFLCRVAGKYPQFPGPSGDCAPCKKAQ